MFEPILRQMREKIRTRQYVMTLHAEEAMEEDERKSPVVCAVCGKSGARVRRVTKSYGKGENLLVIENVPVVVCPDCGESYLTADTLHEVERLKLHRKKLAQARRIAVVAFA